MREPMQVAIVGRISSSKSTLVNAILGKPEVVRTGHEAETFNVSWLKHGDDNAPIVVYFKNGDIEKIDKRAWADWASHKGEASLKAKVKYMEVISSDDMLKYINIIDTPGLDSASKVDSENTIDFLKTIHPDAVVLLFSKSLSGDSLRLIQDFQNSDAGVSFSINPMNALGVLSKMDMNWNIMDNNDALQTSASAIQRTLSNRSDVSKSLFRILPMSALMGLASFCISEEDVADFRELASIGDSKKITKLFISVDFFVKPYDFVTVSVERRKNLILKYGLYNLDGELSLPVSYDSLGYKVVEDKKASTRENNVLLIPSSVGINGIVVCLDGLYGIFDVNKEELILPCAYTKIYSITKSGVTTYYAEFNGQQLDLAEYLKENNLVSVEEDENEDTENTNENTNTVTDANTTSPAENQDVIVENETENTEDESTQESPDSQEQ